MQIFILILTNSSWIIFHSLLIKQKIEFQLSAFKWINSDRFVTKLIYKSFNLYIETSDN